jgi:hypothetical protein
VYDERARLTGASPMRYSAMMSDETSKTDDVPAARSGSALRDALRRARAEAAERTDVVIDLRQAEIARLEIMRDALAPLFASVPSDVDLFDVGLVPGERPRLFVDMVAFVEMGRDRRSYRFMRDGRNGRVVVAESEQVGPIVEAVTDYVARRLVERERLLVDQERFSLPMTGAIATAGDEAPAERSAGGHPLRAQPSVAPVSDPVPSPAAMTAPKPRSRWLRALAILFAFGLGGALGAAVVAGVIVAAAKGMLPNLG